MAEHLWHNLSPGPDVPNVLYAVVEVPKGSRNKYEYSKRAGVIKLDRVLHTPMHYPGDYGFIPQSFFEDGDPLDVLVMMNEPTYPGCVIEVRPVGVLRLIDKGERDDKILAVPATDPEFDDYDDLENLPRHYPNTVEHFFKVYKQLEKNSIVESKGWGNAEAARQTILDSLALYREKFKPPNI